MFSTQPSKEDLLRAQLEDFIAEARQNQTILSRHQNLELALIGAHTFSELMGHVFTSLPELCQLDQVSLCLLNYPFQLKDMLQDRQMRADAYPHLVIAPNDSTLATYTIVCRKPILGSYEDELHYKMFAHYDELPRSVAIIPLIRQSKLLGCLHLGSLNAHRFESGMGTDFIERLGSILTICLENVIMNERLKQISMSDILTNVSNRRYLEQRLGEEISRAQRQEYDLVCFFLDVDHFKKINDSFGHQAGDEVLREVAKRIKQELRSSDVIGRFGGEEFVVLLINSKLENARQVAERIRLSIQDKVFEWDGGECKASISIGMSSLSYITKQSSTDQTKQILLQQADAALYVAKQKGRNQICEYHPEYAD